MVPKEPIGRRRPASRPPRRHFARAPCLNFVFVAPPGVVAIRVDIRWIYANSADVHSCAAEATLSTKMKSGFHIAESLEHQNEEWF